MNYYFVNLYEYSYVRGSGTFYTYNVYSGKSIEDIKKSIIDTLKMTWYDTSNVIDSLENSPSISLEDIQKIFSEELEESINSYELEISEPYTDIEEAIRFYMEYEGSKGDQNIADDSDFYFYGDTPPINKLRSILTLDLQKKKFKGVEGIRNSQIVEEMTKSGVI
jgi:hypothetical protein